MDLNFKDKVALVTGASRGIGRGIALELASGGAKVAVNYVSHEKEADGVVQEITQMGGQAIKCKADVSNSDEVTEMFEQVFKAWNRVDILVNNAGLVRDSLIPRMKEEDWDYIVDVNLKGPFLCTKAALRSMIRQRWGRIVNISSVVGMTGNPGQANYAAAKAGLIGFSRSVAKEVGSRNITINIVSPGYIATDAVEGLSQEFKDWVLEHVPARRLGTPNDISHLVVFLCSEEASYINGQLITVDGGLTMGLGR